MHQTLITLHSIVRWLVLASLLYAIYCSLKGYISRCGFSNKDNAVRHWTATIAHIQLMLGMVLYFQSPIVTYLRENIGATAKNSESYFFGLIHSGLMLTAIVLITIGAAKAKRKPTSRDKFKTMLVWFSIALIIIFIAVPWPFSPLANRPYIR